MEFLPWIVPLLPLVGFLINGLYGTKLPKTLSGGLATLLLWAAFGCSLLLLGQVQAAPDKRIFSPEFVWFGAGSLSVSFKLSIDTLTALMLLIITGVGALIHGYSMGYMSHDKHYSRYFAYLNLFVFFMLLLVMSSNLVGMFVGWEGVGLASYLLIGFWQEKKSATDAGKKAFIVNRIGDAALLIALFLIFRHFGTFEFYGEHGILTKAGLDGAQARGYDLVATTVPILLFVGACGKSAQLPLHVWLPDAMEGPTPVSALIHAATMVTAGVYLLCRTHTLFLLAPAAMTIVAIVGLLTALLAASIGLAQNDIKKVLAYSTVSQLGLMFLACGTGAFGAAMFHVTTHAFFKALLFLGSGSVIHAMSGEQDMRKMGGLAKKLPTTYVTMFIGTLAISGIPGLAGFFSKDEILANAFGGKGGSPLLWAGGLIASAMTAFYMWRMMAKTFSGEFRGTEEQAHHLHESPVSMTAPLGILAILSVLGGYLNPAALKAIGVSLPDTFGRFLGENVEWRTQTNALEVSHSTELLLVAASAAVAVVVSLWAWSAYKKAKNGELLTEKQRESGWYQLVYNKWRIDELYDDIFVSPGRQLATWLWRVADLRGVDGLVQGVGNGITGLSNVLSRAQNGYVRSYALTMLVGVVIVVLTSLLGRGK
ncbi:NADH-quinone oxidoreductase subunit L [Armatimonas sp.]|uniref:NADH-quinone oxidoreductase subunit L n=1 Tax=Armatimonas sp. TaxID=1872638 RepID=UPI0037504C09